jgi:hypothetical protein
MKDVTLVRYPTLRECFNACMGKGDDFVPGEHDYWSGHNGNRPFRKNIKRWLDSPGVDCWGWAEYSTKSIHYWIMDCCNDEELLGLLAHELAHLRKPRYKDHLEERKASLQERDCRTAYTLLKSIRDGE